MANNKEAKVTLKLFNQDFNASIAESKEQTTRLNKEFELQKQQMKLTATETEQLAAKVEYLKQKQEIASKVTQETAQHYERVKQQFGENSKAANQMASKLLDAQIAEQRLANEAKSTSTALQNAEKGINQVGNAANNATKDVKGFSEGFQQALGGLAAGGGIAGTVQQALDTSSLNTKIDITFDVREESKAAIKEAVKTIEAYGIEGEEALEGIRRQWSLNADASDESNQRIIKGAGMIASAYSQVDFVELVQETNETAKALNISNEAALALTNTLLKAGFPPEQLDTISEYGTQLKMAGYNAEEVQAIMLAGVETGTWNIDNLLDGLKEGRIKLAEFGGGVDKATGELLAKTNISKQQLQDWGKSVAAGGEEGTAAMQEVAKALAGVEDATVRNALGVKLFGTKWEDQGTNITDSLLNMNDHMATTGENVDKLNDALNKVDQDPGVKLKQALADIKTALEPVLLIVADIIVKIANWISNNTTLAAIITAVSTALGIITGLFAFLTPAIGTVVGWFGGWGAIMGVVKVALAALTGPIGWIIAGVTILIGIVIAVIKNWETLGPFFQNLWEGIKTVAITVWTAIKDFFINVWNGIKSTVETVWNGISSFFTTIWNTISTIFNTVLEHIKSVIDGYWTSMKDGITQVWEGIKQFFSGIWDLIKNVFVGALLILLQVLTGRWGEAKASTLQIWNNIKESFKTIWEGIKNIFSGALSAVLGFVKKYWENIKTTTSNVFNSVKNILSTIWNGIKTTVSTVVNAIQSVVTSIFNSLKSIVSNAMSGVKTAVVNGWNAAKSFLDGINLLQVGKNIIQGLVNGIGSMKDFVVGVIEDTVGSAIDFAKKLLGIHSPSRVFRQIGIWTGQGLAIGIDDSQSTVKKSLEDLGYLMLDVADHYASEEKKIQEQLANDKVKLNKESAEKIAKLESTAMKNQVKLLGEASKEYLATVQSFIDDKKSLEQLSTVDEARIWGEAINLFDEGTTERIKAQQNYKKALEAVNNEVISINQNYQSKMQSIIENEKKQTEELLKAYQDAENNRYNQLYSFAGTFDAFNTEMKASGIELHGNLQSQVNAFKEWQEQFNQISSRGIDADLLAELSSLGVKALPELKALNTLTDEQLSEYSSLYQEKSRLAREQAQIELVGMKEDTQLRIQELRDTAEVELDKLQVEWKDAIKGITRTTDNELQSLERIGKDAGQGLLNGLSSMESALINKAKQIAASISEAMQSVLQIHSPSKITTKLGEFVGEGLVVGMDNLVSDVTKSATRLAEATSQTITNTTIDQSKKQENNFTFTQDNSMKEWQREMRRQEYLL